MKKLLIVNTTLDKGGASRVARDVFDKMSEGFEVHFAYGRRSESSNPSTDVSENFYYFGSKIETLIHFFFVRFLGLEGFGSHFSTRRLIKYIEDEEFDLINLHNLHGYYLNFSKLFRFLKKAKLPIIYSVHDEWAITWLPAHSLGCVHCKTGVGDCKNSYKYPRNYFPIFKKYMLNKKREMFSEHLNMTIVCPSVWLAENFRNSFLNKFKIEIINNGVDTDIFKPADNKTEIRIKLGLPTDSKIVLFCASDLNDRSKGAHYLLEVSEILKDKDYFFVFVGKGEVAQSENVKKIDYVYEKNKLAELYTASDVFCFASGAETFLLSAAEAMSCGTPVVGFDIPVVRELVNSDVGILTESDSKQLAISIDGLLRDESLRSKMGENGRELIVQKFSKNIFYSKYLSLCNKLMK